MECVSLPDPSALEGIYLHCRGGHVIITRKGDDFIINNPHIRSETMNVPVDEFSQADGLHFYQHTGTFDYSTITWSNGVTWTKATYESEKDHEELPCRYFVIRGQVQNVMFRQTIIRAMQARDVVGGATNHKRENDRVDITVMGDKDTVDEFIRIVGDGRKLNSWGARASSMEEKSVGIQIVEHQVNTVNVDDFSWNSDVTMYI